MTWKHALAVAAAIMLGSALPLGAQTAVGYYTRYREQAAASVPTPAAGWQNTYISSSDHKVYRKDSTGTSTEVGGSGGGGDMVLADVQTVTGEKTFNSGKLVAASPTLSGTVAGTYSIGGTPTLAANTSVASGVDVVAAGGAADFDYSLSSGIFKTPTGAATFGGSSNTFTNGVTSSALVTAPKFGGSGSAPSCAVGAALGTGGSLACSCAGTDTAMECTFTAGASGATTGTWATITYASTFTTKPYCVLSAGTAITATSAVGYTVAVNRASSSATQMIVESGGPAANGATYYFGIHCLK